MKTIAQQLNVKEFPFDIKDSRGKRIYFENSNGFWWKREHGSNGKQIHHKDSKGFWWKREYDSNGKEIYYENSTGYWFKSEYDSQGKEIYFENSKGTIIDDRPKPTCEGKTVEIDGITYKLMKA
jgi:hypothetical protein